MSIYAFPQFAGVRFRESNIVPRSTDSGNGDYTFPSNFYDLIYQWANEGPTSTAWTQWIKPQIDGAYTLGINVVRFMFDATLIVGDSTHHGAATWQGTITTTQLGNCLDQLITYLASKGMYYYATGTDSRPINNATYANVSVANVESYITTFVGFVSQAKYNNVIAVDVVQEADGALNHASGFTATNVGNWISTAKAAMVKSLPCTCSLNGAASSSDLDPASRAMFGTLQAGGVDYFDIHVYYNFAVKDMLPALNNSYGLPVVMGESGINRAGDWSSNTDNESTHPYSSEKRSQFYGRLSAAASLYNFQLVGVWAIVDQSTYISNDWGLLASTQDGSYNFTTQNTDITIPYQLIPLVNQGLNSPFIPTLAFGDTNATDYSTFTYYSIQGAAMVTPGVQKFQLRSNAINVLGPTSGSLVAGNVLYVDLPNSINQTIQFDIPAGRTYTRYNSNYVTFVGIVRGQGNGDLYTVELSSDSANVFDNQLVIAKYVGGTRTVLGTQQYGQNVGSVALDLTKTWRVNCTVTGTSPTILVATVTNVTNSIVMSPALTVSDSSATLQSAGGMGLSYYAGQPYYTNVQFSHAYDNGPQIGSVPTGSASGKTVNLSWVAALGGTGTITYTPQYSVADANGFPTTWNNASSTTSLSASISGLLANTNYLFRIQQVDTVPATNYSMWSAQILTGAGHSSSTSLGGHTSNTNPSGHTSRTSS